MAIDNKLESMNEIERSNPDVGYIDPSIYEEINVSQVVKTKGLIHYSGIVPARPDGSCVAPGNMGEQVYWVLEVLQRLLRQDGLSVKNLVSITVYTTDIEMLEQHMAIFSEAFEGAAPAVTWVEVRRLADPEYFLEIVPVAAA